MLIALLVSITAGCEGDSSDDVGDNDPNLVACVGDSLTMGYNSEGVPYPRRLAAITGKTVLDFGVGGQTSSYGVSVISPVLSRKPGYVCILFGSNDVILQKDTAGTINNLRYIIQACKANKTIPVIATIPPMILEHRIFNSGAGRLNESIRQLAKEEGVRLVDLWNAFGDGTGYLNPNDGLHFTNSGGDLVANSFAKKL